MRTEHLCSLRTGQVDFFFLNRGTNAQRNRIASFTYLDVLMHTWQSCT